MILTGISATPTASSPLLWLAKAPGTPGSYREPANPRGVRGRRTPGNRRERKLR